MCRKLTDSLLDAQKVHGSWWKIPQMDGKLTEVYIRSHGCTESWQRLTECPVDSRKFEWRFCRCTEKLTEVDERSNWHRKSWRKFQRMNRKFKEVPMSPRKVDRHWWKVMHRKLMDCPSDVQKVDRSWRLDHTSTFRASAESSFNFHQISVCLSDYISIFRTSAGSSFNFRQLAVRPRDLP